jgi:hypothetical protein
MPPAAMASLPPDTYAAIVAYILEVNGATPGSTALPADLERLSGWAIP